MGGVCIECGDDCGTNYEECVTCASFFDGRNAERARIVEMLRERAEKIRQAAHAGPLATLDIGEAIAEAIDAEANRIERGE